MSGVQGDADARKQLIAGVYDRGASGYSGIGYFPLHARRLVELADIAAGSRVLDVACGRGAVLFAAAKQVGDTGHVLGVDISSEMAGLTGSDIAARGLRNASTRQMDAEHLDFADASFDCVLCAFSLQFFPHLDRALAEFRRVLKPGGFAAVTTWGQDDPAWDWYDDLVAEYGAKAGLRSQRLDDPEVVTGHFTSAGFADVETRVETIDFVFRDDSEWWNMRWNLSGRAALEQLDAPMLERFTAEANDRLETMRRPDGLHELQEVIYTLAFAPER
jgi:ubiquinone/menaquinone biosynthesis C-methylase UbiE